jgi:hypothetical protein
MAAERTFAAYIDEVLGLEGVGAVLTLLGVDSQEQLGIISDSRWEETIPWLPSKRLDTPSDLHDKSRLGPGHWSHLDDFRREASYTHVTKSKTHYYNNTYSNSKSGTRIPIKK